MLNHPKRDTLLVLFTSAIIIFATFY